MHHFTSLPGKQMLLFPSNASLQCPGRRWAGQTIPGSCLWDTAVFLLAAPWWSCSIVWAVPNEFRALGGSSSFPPALPLQSLGVLSVSLCCLTAQSWFVAWHRILEKGSDLNAMCTPEILKLWSKQEIQHSGHFLLPLSFLDPGFASFPPAGPACPSLGLGALWSCSAGACCARG